MNGRLCGTLTEDQLKVANKLKSALSDVLTGIIGANGDPKQEKTVSVYFLAMSYL